MVDSRIIFADLIIDAASEKRITQEITNWGFTVAAGSDNTHYSTYENSDLKSFLTKLKNEVLPVHNDWKDMLAYVDTLSFWIYRESVLPLTSIIIEVCLDKTAMQGLSKEEVRKTLQLLPFGLNMFFSTKTNLLAFSKQVFPNMLVRNLIMNITYEVPTNLIQQISEKTGTIETKDVLPEKKAQAQEEFLSLLPLTFFDPQYPRDVSIITGYTNTLFVLQKFGGFIYPSSMDNLPPLCLLTLAFAGPSPGNTPALTYSDKKPVLQFPGYPIPLDFSRGAGQIVALYLLNLWSRFVQISVRNEIKNLGTRPDDEDGDIDKTLEELQEFAAYRNINEKISVNYVKSLQTLSSFPQGRFLHEFYVISHSDPIMQIISGFGEPQMDTHEAVKAEGVVSSLAQIILNNLEPNSKMLEDVIGLLGKKIEVLKIREDRKISRWMLILTVVISVLAILNFLTLFVNHILFIFI